MKLSIYKNATIFSILHEEEYLLYRNILLWYPESYSNVESKKNVKNRNLDIPRKDFRIDELGNWLLDHHLPFKREYESSNLTYSNRLQQKRDTIKKVVNNLVELKLLTVSKEVDSDRNKNIKTKEYRFTKIGIIFSWLIATYREKNTKNYSMCIDMFLSNFIPSFQNWYKVSIFEFVKNLLDNCIKNKIIEKFIELEKYIGLFIKLIYEKDISSIRRSLLAMIVLDKNIYEIFVQTINNLDDNKKNYLLLQFKLEIESLFENIYHIPDTLKNWELIRYENRNKSDVITIIGNCPICGNIPFRVNIFRFFDLFWRFSEFYFFKRENSKTVVLNKEYLNKLSNSYSMKGKSSIQKELCPKCNKNKLNTYFRIQKDTTYEEILIYIDENMISLKELADKSINTTPN